MRYERVNIGLLIEQTMNGLGLNKSELARRIGVPNQNVNRLFEKTSIDTDKLITISEALDCDFFANYRPIGSTDGSNNAVASGDGAVAVNGNGTAHHFTTNASSDAVLAERVKALEALLAEKERLIKVLMENRK